MTRVEAIAILDGFKYNPLFNEQHFEAFDMAVSALSENKGDLISRQAVLDYIDKMPSELTEDGRRMIRRRTLEEYISDTLPSVSNSENSNKGEWKRISPAGIYECSCCGQNVMTSDIECYKFCHGCGADMRKGEI